MIPTNNDHPWNTYSVISKLVEAADILLHKKDYDGHGWEEIEICYKRGQEILKQISENMKEHNNESQHPLWMTMNQLDFIKSYLQEHFTQDLPDVFWKTLDECNLNVRKQVKKHPIILTNLIEQYHAENLIGRFSEDDEKFVKEMLRDFVENYL